jgi:hypothetical protein
MDCLLCKVNNHLIGVVYSIQQYVIKFVSDLQQVSGFLQVMLYVSLGLFELLALCVGGTPDCSTNKIDRHGSVRESKWIVCYAK